jgi:hypothetical protein
VWGEFGRGDEEKVLKIAEIRELMYVRFSFSAKNRSVICEGDNPHCLCVVLFHRLIWGKRGKGGGT